MVTIGPMTGPTMIVRTPLSREALEWNGENLRDVQAFMWPHSPLFHVASTKDGREPVSIYGAATVPTLRITIRDREQELKYPTLGQQFSVCDVQPGDWIWRDGDAFAVIRKGEFDAEWVRQGPAPAWVSGDIEEPR